MSSMQRSRNNLLQDIGDICVEIYEFRKCDGLDDGHFGKKGQTGDVMRYKKR